MQQSKTMTALDRARAKAFGEGKQAGYTNSKANPYLNKKLSAAWWTGYDVAKQEERDERQAKMECSKP